MLRPWRRWATIRSFPPPSGSFPALAEAGRHGAPRAQPRARPAVRPLRAAGPGAPGGVEPSTARGGRGATSVPEPPRPPPAPSRIPARAALPPGAGWRCRLPCCLAPGPLRSLLRLSPLRAAELPPPPVRAAPLPGPPSNPARPRSAAPLPAALPGGRLPASAVRPARLYAEGEAAPQMGARGRRLLEARA